MRIIAIENEAETIFIIRYSLIGEGFDIKSASDGMSGLKMVKDETPDLVILSCALPDIDGLEVCRKIRSDPETARTPIIILSEKTKEPDGIIGLEMGADDYMIKPFSSRELRARIKAILRRTHQKRDKPLKLFYGNLEVDTAAYTVKDEGKAVELTPKEFKLLESLIKHKGHVMSRQIILNSVWHVSVGSITTRTVDTHIGNLRKKIPILADSIVTIKQFGYKLKEEE